MKATFWVLPFLFAAGLTAAELPVRQVVLYKHGIGYFQRSGQLAPGETAQLDFKAEEMNDVLKSLTIQEGGAATITGLRYDSSEPLERKLSEFPFKVGPGQPLSAILDQLKGAQVELRFASETVRGTLLAARLVPRTEQRPESEQITLLLDSGEFRNFDLSAATSLRFADATLQTQFQEYLATLHTARSREKRSVYIDSSGSQARQLAATYMIPMPVWKSSYRLIFGASGEPLLEGWAIVDNTTGEDWSNVQLSLVSGRPISFVSRLYEPRYLSRPVAELPEDRAQAPVLYQGGIEEGSLDAAGGAAIEGTVRDRSGAVVPRARVTVRAMNTGLSQTVSSDGRGHYSAQLAAGIYEVSAQMPGFQLAVQRGIEVAEGQRARVDITLDVGEVAQRLMVGDAMAPPPAQERIRVSNLALPSSTRDQVAAQELGELFEYRFDRPVTVRNSESAMLPFLQQKLNARKLLVYSNTSSVHPLHSAEITNSTGKTLDGGPITVYEDGGYAGEALVETLKMGDKRLISYGVDLGTRVTTALDSRDDIVREIHFRRGVLTAKTAAVETKTYTINNVDEEAKTLIIEHPIRREYKVLNQEPVETTATAYRFEVSLAPGATEKFAVTEERVYDRTLAVANLTPDVLISYIQNKDLNEAARNQLQLILDKKREVAEVDGEIVRIQAQISSVFQDQERLRQNISSLSRVPGQEQQVQTYARQLAAQEGQLATLRDRLAQLQQRKATLEAELNTLIERMEF